MDLLICNAGVFSTSFQLTSTGTGSGLDTSTGTDYRFRFSKRYRENTPVRGVALVHDGQRPISLCRVSD